MSLKDRIKGRVLAMDAAARPWAARSPLRAGLYEFLLFGLKQAWASLFAAAMLALLLGSHFLWPADAAVARYDFLVLAALSLQVLFLATRLERWDEALVILIFHVVGTIMEVFKTAHGSWIYPEPSLLRIGGVPLFSGFMYAAIGSYIARIWRLFDVRFTAYPPLWAPWLLAILAYGNFFTHHYGPDIRWGLFALSGLVFWRTWFTFTPDLTPRRMPMIVGALLVALFIWIAENLGTFASAWIYPSQRHGWALVSFGKLGSWYLLIMLSFVLVSLVHRPRAPGEGETTNPLLTGVEEDESLRPSPLREKVSGGRPTDEGSRRRRKEDRPRKTRTGTKRRSRAAGMSPFVNFVFFVVQDSCASRGCGEGETTNPLLTGEPLSPREARGERVGRGAARAGPAPLDSPP